ncbi:unnamed protein product [Mytilus coruscus]|uniref:Uncharacterized protein n=1 Tax=Mytilus coruscus TaxID=42192 RepID=A0A6J8F3R5_MYTCO|nr:unnamed protein product [Mytilus coruscus]
MRSGGSDVVAEEESASVTSETSNMGTKRNKIVAVRKDTLSISESDSERQNSGFLFSENGSEHSEYASFVDNRSVADLEGIKSTERFQRYLGNKPEDTTTATITSDLNQKVTCNVLGGKFGEYAYAYRSKDKTGIVLEQNQTDILKGTWRSGTPQKRVCWLRDSDLKLLSAVPCLFSKELKSLEKIAYQGQPAARMGLITSCHLQQALGIFLDNLQSNTSNLDGAVHNVRDIFALSTETLDQMSKTGAFTIWVPGSLLIKRKVTSSTDSSDNGFKKGKFDNGFMIPQKLTADFKSGATQNRTQKLILGNHNVQEMLRPSSIKDWRGFCQCSK